jgi:hypothetical protein
LQSFEAIKKYVSLDDKALLMTLENFKPVMDAYRGFFKVGAAQYTEKKYPDAYASFKNCLDVSEYMASKNWTNVKLDTTVILYTGICAENSNRKDDAATYYARLADAKLPGDEYREIYKWLTGFYYEKKDNANATKYLTVGRSLFPKEPYWEMVELDMLSKQDDKTALFTKYEEVIAKNPSDTTTLFNYAVQAYVYAYSPEADKRPANSAQLIEKSETLLKKVVELKPDFASASLVLGQINYNRSVDLTNQAKAIRPPAGGKLKPEELKKKDELRTESGKKMDEAIPYFEKVDQVLGTKGKLPFEDKKVLKDTYDLLIAIYEAKQKADKVKVYEEKFNNVDKIH